MGHSLLLDPAGAMLVFACWSLVRWALRLGDLAADALVPDRTTGLVTREGGHMDQATVLRIVNRHRKLIVALAGALVIGLTSYLGADAPIVQTVVAVLTALGVYQIPNEG